MYMPTLLIPKQQTGWETKRDLTQMMEDAWRWVKNNPNGYED